MDKSPECEIALSEIETGIALTKCQQCGCMHGTLEQMDKSLPSLPEERTVRFSNGLPRWAEKIKPIGYTCLGCEHCYAGAAQNAFTAAFPEVENQFGLACEIQSNHAAWPPVVGEYIVLDPSAPVAVTTLASPGFPRQLADLKIPGVAIIGKLETENIGIEKIIKNTISNPRLRFLILAGADTKGHQCGQTLLALFEHGVDEKGRVIASKGKHPILRNVNRTEIEAFRTQIKVVDLIGCECTDCVRDKAAELCNQIMDISSRAATCGCSDGSCQEAALPIDGVPTVFIEETDRPVKLDKTGYFVILPVPDRKVIQVEHYSYDNSLLHVIEGVSSRSLYLKIIEAGWVSELSHAAYLGKELAKAELNLTLGIPFNQDAA